MFRYFFACAFICTPLIAEIASSEDEFVAQINAFLAIRDFRGAAKACRVGRDLFPDSPALSNLEIRVLAEHGDVKKALTMMPSISNGEQLRKSFHLLEALSWNQLLFTSHTSQMEQFAALYGAAMTGDARAVGVILKTLRSTNAYLRYIAVKLASRYNDKVLQNEILRLIKEEKNWFVKSVLIEAVGVMKLEGGKDFLREVIESRRSSQDEKALAIQSYVHLCEGVEAEHLNSLLESKRAPLRELGIALIEYYELEKDYPKIFTFLEDHSPEVKMRALASLAVLDVDAKVLSENKGTIRQLAAEPNPAVAILAHWVYLKINSEKAIEGLEYWVKNGSREIASFAATLLGHGGNRTAIVVQRLLEREKDPYVRVNLAQGLVYQQTDIEKAKEVLSGFINENREDLMWRHIGGLSFGIVAPSIVRHVPYMAQYPKLIDQMTRLDLINMLSVIQYDGAKELMKEYLQKHIWGVSASAAGLMLEEGDLDAIDVIRELLTDTDPKMRLQSALALAFFGKDPSVVTTLTEAYDKVDWEKKMHILEALGHIGSRDSIPFLIGVMKQGTPLFQKVASGSVIQCLYH